MHMDVDFVIAITGTVSTSAVIPAGFRLQSLNVPAIDNATLTLTLSDDDSTFRATFDAAAATGVVQAASVGSRIVTIADPLSRATEGRAVKVTAGAAQNTAAVTIRGRCVETKA
jgi:hypothetical protein